MREETSGGGKKRRAEEKKEKGEEKKKKKKKREGRKTVYCFCCCQSSHSRKLLDARCFWKQVGTGEAPRRVLWRHFRCSVRARFCGVSAWMLPVEFLAPGFFSLHLRSQTVTLKSAVRQRANPIHSSLMPILI